MQTWENWELAQRRHAVTSLIEFYAEKHPGSRRHRMYLQELDAVNAEIERRKSLVRQLSLFDVV